MAVSARTGHSLTLEERERLLITGVTDVVEFNEEGIIAQTDMGILSVKGEELKVTRLDIEGGFLDIEGSVESLEYSDALPGISKGTLLKRIFK